MLTQIQRRSAAGSLAADAQLPARLINIYANRGINQLSEIDTSLKQLIHFNQLKGIQQAASILADAIQNKTAICIVGDFDADGATSTALCMLSLSMLGCRTHQYLVPNRFDFGYGLSPQIVDVAHSQQARLLMTVDSGIACIAGVKHAKDLGMQVIITDHHLAADELPGADAIVNPNQPGCDFPSKNLAGVGVAFYMMLALKAELKQRGHFNQANEPNLAELLDIVALGTVADVVKLDHNNRILVHQGLQRIRSGRCRAGIQAILDVAGRKSANLAASDLGFVVGPRLNAAGRLDDMSQGIECLLCEDIGLAREMAVRLDSLNRERREIEASMQHEALKALDSLTLNDQHVPFGLCLYQPDWHQGVIGILAGRIKEKYHRPTIAFAHQDDEFIKGSARSIAGVHIRDLLEDINSRFPNLITKFGGHAMAAGLTLPVASINDFGNIFAQTCERWLEGKPLTGTVLSDGALQGTEMTLDFARMLKQAGPWGQGFEEPCFDDTFYLLEQKIVGQKHLKLQVSNSDGQSFDAIAFNIDTQQWPNHAIKKVQLAYKLELNEFRGNVSVQLLVEAINPA
ncbi:single-stranded-DNA-specific exonuclease RecJ [Neptunicella marina]|uniref:Single-stranded-DNA-specific exonuclease RecJ n=1 Tax=Neptunicella marina TaxID=2125989 RepID=A0A8J6IT18_9ALTE|nr:single-stranded-DNA-specific exonuclease RecJ [Neptunicella marina]MBC3766915.1 single-stranded-DNA-specific exonuclease RecJ [Neptunicella marina]